MAAGFEIFLARIKAYFDGFGNHFAGLLCFLEGWNKKTITHMMTMH